MSKFIKEIDIPYYECDNEGILFPSSILKFLSEVAILHNEFNLSKQADNSGWMLNKWRLKIGEYPKGKDRITIETWVSKVDRFYVTREFRIYLRDIEIARASSLWIYMDINKRRPIRIKDSDLDPNSIIEDFNFDGFSRLDFDISNGENDTFFKLRRSDIDTNQHVNNVKYFDWILESIDENFYRENSLEEVEIEYKKELKYPEKVRIKLEGNLKNVKHIVTCQSQINVLSRTSWNKKNN